MKLSNFKYFTMLLFSCLSMNSYSIEIGATREMVLSELGTPKGVIKSGNYEMFSYERGKVKLRDGLVTTANIISVKELNLKKEKSALLAKQRAHEKEKFIKSNHQRGLVLREKIATSKVFPEFSGQRKVKILKDFSKTYPDIDIADLLNPAIKEMEQEQVNIDQQNKIAELERKIDDAKMEALRAQWRESAARADAQDLMRSQFYLQQHSINYYPCYHVQNGGLSVGYESPTIRINYSSGYRGNSCYPISSENKRAACYRGHTLKIDVPLVK